MIKENQKYIKLVLCFFSFIFFTNSVISGENPVKPDFYIGKVLYTDTNIPVNNGFVKLYISKTAQSEEKIIALVEIQSNGIFKLPRSVIPETDGIKIMAYANDLDNNQDLFESSTSDFKSVMNNSDEKFDLILSVRRVKNF